MTHQLPTVAVVQTPCPHCKVEVVASVTHSPVTDRLALRCPWCSTTWAPRAKARAQAAC